LSGDKLSALNLFCNVDDLTLAAKARHNFHQALEKNVAGDKEEKTQRAAGAVAWFCGRSAGSS
jgi:hypothetical protein